MGHFTFRHLLLVPLALGMFGGLAVAQGPISSDNGGLLFVPITPCRVVDTRNVAGTFGGPIMAAQSTRQFPIPIGSCSVPSSAAAYSLNVTVFPQAALNYLTVWPSGQTQPVVSTLNSDGRVKMTAAIVPSALGGAGLDVYVSDTTHVAIDINGYFTSDVALAYYPVTPCRVIDTRRAAAPLAGPFLSGGFSRTFPILSSTCAIPSVAQVYFLNVSALPHRPLNYLTAWPAGQAQPAVPNLSAPTGAVTANAAIVPAGNSGSITLFASDSTDVVIDINGYFAPESNLGLGLHLLPTPCRVLDTRKPVNSPPFSGQLAVNVTGSTCGASLSGASAFVLNATVVPKSPLNWLTLWPDGVAQPLASTLNAYDRAVTSNLAIVPTSSGSINAFASSSTFLILDIASYFAP